MQPVLTAGPAVQLCITYNADINAQDEDNGGSPLMYAIHNAHDHIIEKLLDQGAGMDQYEQQGYTPLMVACLSDNATACERLLQQNADLLEQTDTKGRTALSMACRCAPSSYWSPPSTVTLCPMIGRYSAACHVVLEQWWWREYRYGSLECVKVLTNQLADVQHRDADGISVLEHAEQNDRRQVVTVIKRAQLANQMRQRRKQKSQHKGRGMSNDEYEAKDQEARARMAELLQACPLTLPLCAAVSLWRCVWRQSRLCELV